MSERPPLHPGRVEWSGDNPGIYLKTDAAGDWATLGIFFRVVLSPHGRGHTAIVLERPGEAVGWPQAANLCLTDNEPLTRYLLDGYLRRFPAFKGRAGVDAMTWMTLDTVTPEGDPHTRYAERVRGGGHEVLFVWARTGEPFVVDVTPATSATGEHDMVSLFLEADDAWVEVDGRRLPGQPVKRPLFGRSIASAFLAFSETWVRPPD